ncbi:MAG: hypothetical protein ACREMN_12755 [Gemmatimonadales bacterium]
MTTLIAFGVLGALLAWFFWPKRRDEYERPPRSELEAAERDVREAPDEHSVRDWGPGAPKPPLL